MEAPGIEPSLEDAKPLVSREIRDPSPPCSVPIGEAKSPISGGLSDSKRNAAPPQVALFAALLAATLEAATAGDLDGACIAHEASGKLLVGLVAASRVKPDALPLAESSDTRDEHRGADVIDLDRARATRGGGP